MADDAVKMMSRLSRRSDLLVAVGRDDVDVDVVALLVLVGHVLGPLVGSVEDRALAADGAVRGHVR